MEGGVGWRWWGGVVAGNLNVAGELCMYDHTFLKCYRERFSSPSPPFSRPFRLFSPPHLSSPPPRPEAHCTHWSVAAV